jgi:hypothetical protein
MVVTLVSNTFWRFFFPVVFDTEISLGARPALPMGVAPEDIVEFFLGIDSSILFSCVLYVAAPFL